mmetsp:Transcript_18074/g.44961  ORF Transcript_18074/g.44961 Transcript_18074/m.44961 type:complete len:156 (-) Transcript_18074:8140-8607(-)
MFFSSARVPLKCTTRKEKSILQGQHEHHVTWAIKRQCHWIRPVLFEKKEEKKRRETKASENKYSPHEKTDKTLQVSLFGDPPIMILDHPREAVCGCVRCKHHALPLLPPLLFSSVDNGKEGLQSDGARMKDAIVQQNPHIFRIERRERTTKVDMF